MQRFKEMTHNTELSEIKSYRHNVRENVCVRSCRGGTVGVLLALLFSIGVYETSVMGHDLSEVMLNNKYNDIWTI